MLPRTIMRVTALLFLTLTIYSEAWSFQNFSPRRMAAKITKGCATLATCAALMSPMNAFADDTGTSFKVDINVPYLVELVKTKEERTNTFDRVSFLAESIKNLFGPAVSVQLPTDIKGVVKDALSGGASVTINELDVGIKVVGSEKGALTIQLSNDLLPALPFVGLPTTPGFVNAAGDVVASSAPAVVDAVLTNIKEGPFWERPIFGGSVRLDLSVGNIDIHKAITPLDALGGGSLGLGVVYASSYAYYRYSIDQEERAARAKQEAAAAKKAVAEAKKKEEEYAARIE